MQLTPNVPPPSRDVPVRDPRPEPPPQGDPPPLRDPDEPDPPPIGDPEPEGVVHSKTSA